MSYRAPKTEMEVMIARILQNVLEAERVGLDDNFFDLGGNSLLLVQVHARLQAALGREIAPVEIFNHPTAGALAAHLEGHRDAASTPPVDDRKKQLERGRARLLSRRGRRSEGTASPSPGDRE